MKFLSSMPALIMAGLIIVFGGAPVRSAVTVYSPSGLQGEFIADTTAQWNATVATALFAGDQKIILMSRKTPLPPPPPTQTIDTATAFSSCVAYGFGNGMEAERRFILDYVDHFQQFSSTYTLKISSNTVIKCVNLTPSESCPQFFLDWINQMTFQFVDSVYGYIDKRNFKIFNSTGGLTSP